MARLDRNCTRANNMINRAHPVITLNARAIRACELEALPVPHFAVSRPETRSGRQASCQVYLQISA